MSNKLPETGLSRKQSHKLRALQKQSVRTKLALATCSLLSSGVTTVQAEGGEDWAIDTSFLSYSEEDRISVEKLVSSLITSVSESDKVKVDIVFDTMSGSTPSGAVRDASSLTTISTPSGAGGFTASSGDSSIAHFEDTRLGVALDWEHTRQRTHRINYGGSLSVEKDYTSFGLSTNYAQDTSSRIVTYSAGIAASFDSVRRSNGGTPLPLTLFGDPVVLEEGSRVTFDTIFGVTRVLNRRTLAQINFSAGFSDGYLTDPYKLVSLTQGNAELETYYESRPSERQRNSVYMAMVHKTRHDNVLHMNYRYYWDDWDIVSNTLDFRLKFNFDDGYFLEPHVRIYNQSAAYFYVYSISQEDFVLNGLPDYASADYRLDEMDDLTIGLNFGINFAGEGKLRIRLEKIQQQFANSVYPENNATVFQISYQKLFE